MSIINTLYVESMDDAVSDVSDVYYLFEGIVYDSKLEPLRNIEDRWDNVKDYINQLEEEINSMADTISDLQDTVIGLQEQLQEVE